MKKINLLIMIVFLALFTPVSCIDKSFDELLADPDSIRPENIDLDAGFIQVQKSFANMFHSAQSVGAELTRMEYMFGMTYENANSPGTASGAWNNAYTAILPEIKLLIDKATTDGKEGYIPLMKIMRAYTLMTLVDFWGDVPYSEAILGTDNLNPAADTGDSVYEVALADLNAAIAELNSDPEMDDITDFYYNGDTDKWTRLAKTFKLKYYLNTGNVSKINSLIAEGDLLGVGDDFMFRWDPSTDPYSRHPDYISYTNENPPLGTYMSTYYMWVLGFEKGFKDPRTAYYFYRQTDTYPTATDIPSLTDALPCSDNDSPYGVGVPYCSLPDGFWGRDHGDDAGIPPDQDVRTVFGIYPAGGSFDENDPSDISDGDGLSGAGISPIMMASYVDFMIAEAIIRLGASGNARAYLEDGINKSFNFVSEFGASQANGTGYEITTSSVTNYLNFVLSAYDALSSDEERINMIGKEFYISLYGNGIESYNLYRRTGAPDNLQPALLLAAAGPFPASLFYTTQTSTLNTSIQQKPDLTQKVFWDVFSYDLY